MVHNLYSLEKRVNISYNYVNFCTEDFSDSSSSDLFFARPKGFGNRNDLLSLLL